VRESALHLTIRSRFAISRRSSRVGSQNSDRSYEWADLQAERSFGTPQAGETLVCLSCTVPVDWFADWPPEPEPPLCTVDVGAKALFDCCAEEPALWPQPQPPELLSTLTGAFAFTTSRLVAGETLLCPSCTVPIDWFAEPRRAPYFPSMG